MNTHMPSNITTVTIGENQYVLQKLSATKALKTKARIVAVISPVLSDLVGMAPKTGEITEDDKMRIGKNLASIIPQLDTDKATDLVIDLCSTARTIDGQPLDFDTAFYDDLMPAYELAIEVVKFNYSKYIQTLMGNTTAKPESQT